MKEHLRDIVITIAIAIVLFMGIQASVQNYVIWESCMEPTLYEGNQVLVNKLVYRFQDPDRGDIIILRPPESLNSNGIPYIKRIVGLPGEIVKVENGNVFIDGVKLNEPYIAEDPLYYVETTVPDDEYFVLGDNRNHANDSSKGWTVPRENIIGKAWLNVWPASTWGTAANYSFD